MASKSTAAATGNALWSKIPKANAELFALTYGALVTELLRDYGEDNIDKVNEQLDRMGHSIGMRCVDEYMAKSYTYMAEGGYGGGGGSGGSGGPPGSGNVGSKGGSGSSNVSIMACTTFLDTAEVLAKSAFKMFLGITADVVVTSSSSKSSTQQSQSQSGNTQQSSSYEQQIDDDPTGTTGTGGSNIPASASTTKTQSFSLMFYDNPLATFVELPDHFKDKLEYSVIYCGIIRGALEMLNMRVKCTFIKSTLKGDDCNEIKVELQEVLADGAGDEYKDE